MKYSVNVARKSPQGNVAYRRYSVDAPDVSTAKEMAIAKCKKDNPKDTDFSIDQIQEQ